MNLREKVKQLQEKLLSVEFRLAMLYGLLKELDTITEGELRDYIERQLEELTPEQKMNIVQKKEMKLSKGMEKAFETLTPETKEREKNTE